MPCQPVANSSVFRPVPASGPACGSHRRRGPSAAVASSPPIVARLFPAYQLFHASRASLQPNMQFAAVEFQEPSLVWYFRSGVQGFLTPLNKRRAAEFMTAPDPRFIVLPTPLAGELFSKPPAGWRFFTINAFNIAKGKRVDLTLVLKPD